MATMMRRESVLDKRHRELGCELDGDTWNNMVMPWNYTTDPYVEIAVMRTWAGLYDVSGLYVKHVKGPDAEAVVDHLVTCDCTAIKVGQAALGCELNDEGHIVDDIMISRDGPEHFRLTHGEGATPENLAASAEGKNVTIEVDEDTHILSLQGPRSLAVLDAECDVDLADLKYFHHTPAKLFGKDVIIGRGGYSGERGYEIYCTTADAVFLWDAILKAGKSEGVMACSWNALEISRVEAGLLFFPIDMPEGDNTPWEINYAWSVSDEGDYRGKQALMAAKGKERFRQTGIMIEHSGSVAAGDRIYLNGKDVGRVNSPTYSQQLMQSIALVHLANEAAAPGTSLEVEHAGKRYPAQVVRTPFYDPMRLRTDGIR